MPFSSAYVAHASLGRNRKVFVYVTNCSHKGTARGSLSHKLGGVSTPGGFPMRKRLDIVMNTAHSG